MPVARYALLVHLVVWCASPAQSVPRIQWQRKDADVLPLPKATRLHALIVSYVMRPLCRFQISKSALGKVVLTFQDLIFCLVKP